MITFFASPLGRVLLGLVFVAGLLAAAWFDGYASGLKAERAAILSKIERQNNAAGNSADGARGAYDKCVDGGGAWNFGTGKCRWPQAGRGD